MRTCTPHCLRCYSARCVKRLGRDTDRRQRRRLAAQTIRTESGCDKSCLRSRVAFTLIEAAFGPDRNQYRTRLEASNRVAERLAAGRADNGEWVLRHWAN